MFTTRQEFTCNLFHSMILLCPGKFGFTPANASRAGGVAIRNICQYSGSDTARYLLYQIQPTCKSHRHYTHQEAVRLIAREQAISVGTKQLCLVPNHKIILCVFPDREQVGLMTRDEATQLCDTGHAEWRRTNVIYLYRNIPCGPALSLLIGGELAIMLQTKGRKEIAQTAIEDICGRA